MTPKLDARAVAEFQLPDGKSDHTHWIMEGFGLRLRRTKTGVHKAWTGVPYRVGGQQRRPSLPFKVPMAEARKKLAEIAAKVALGHDPQGEKQAQRRDAARTVKAVVADYLEAQKPEWRPGSYRVATLYLTGSYYKTLHQMPVNAVKRSDVSPATRAIARQHSPTTAGAARRALSAFFGWSIAEGVLGDAANPVDGSYRPDDTKPRDYVPTNEEVVAIWNVCDGTDDFSRIVRLQILLACRRQEIGGMKWDELDLTAGVWVLPAARSKNHRAHEITLPPTALAIIESVPRRACGYLFGKNAGGGFNSWGLGKEQLEARLAGQVRQFRTHDLRRFAASSMADIGIEPHIIEAVLNHYSGHRAGVAGVYNRARYVAKIKSALLRWDAHIVDLVEGKLSSNVVTLRA